MALVTHLNGKSIPNNTGFFKFPWLEYARTSLDNVGLSYFWNCPNPVPIDPKYITTQVKTRIRDARKQAWLTEINANRHCNLYRHFKDNIGIEKYLQILAPSLRIAMSKFRMGSHHLPSNNDRFKPSKGAKTDCNLCKSSLTGDEFHYIFVCSYLETERKKLLPVKYLETQCPSTALFSQLFMETDPTILTNLAKFCKIIMKLFKKEQPLVLSPLKVRSTHVMASGRVSKRPGYLNDYFV